MSATTALKAALAAGVSIETEAGELVLEARAKPPGAVLDNLKRNKAEIVTFFAARPVVWSSEDCLAHFEERAAILEFDAGLPRREAERLALEECFELWRRYRTGH